jgi:hypothetical protein
MRRSGFRAKNVAEPRRRPAKKARQRVAVAAFIEQRYSGTLPSQVSHKPLALDLKNTQGPLSANAPSAENLVLTAIAYFQPITRGELSQPRATIPYSSVRGGVWNEGKAAIIEPYVLAGTQRWTRRQGRRCSPK